MAPMDVDESNQPLPVEAKGLTYCYGGGISVDPAKSGDARLIDVHCAFQKGSRVLVAGSNGAGKSTLLSILGGKKMVPREQARIFDKPVFHDSSVNLVRMYCGDWWRTDFFFNITVAELIGEKMLASDRVQRLIDIMQINVSWRINACSDGQRRRCQLLESLALQKDVYILDEITTDLDLFAREGLLRFLRQESEERGATIIYATHIFDHLADWATHIAFFSKGRLARCCSLDNLSEYHDLVATGARCPLYMLMRKWIFEDAEPATDPAAAGADPEIPQHDGHVLETRGLSYSYSGGSPQIDNMSFTFGRGERILVVGGNGAGKSTLLSILGGKRMIPRGYAFALGKDCFNDPAVSREVNYCGDWWRTKFFMNLKLRDVIGKRSETSRCQHLAHVLQVNLDWQINDLSDGQRRRCQLLECLSNPRTVYLMDEITSDLDLFAREGLLNFLRYESDVRGATIFYCTHIFDHLEGWPTQLLHISKGSVVKSCPMDEVTEYAQLVQNGNPTPLYSLIRRWIYAEYEADAAMPWRRLENTDDGRLPNLGLAGPCQTVCG